MKIYTPGFPTQYVDEDPPVVKGARAVITVEEAIALAEARARASTPVVQEGEKVAAPQTEVLTFTRGPQVESPLIDNSKGVTNPDNISGRLEHGAPPVQESEPAKPASEPATPVESNTVTFTPDPNATVESGAAALVSRLSEFGVTTPTDDLLK